MLSAYISMVSMSKGGPERIYPLIVVRISHILDSIQGSHAGKLFCILSALTVSCIICLSTLFSDSNLWIFFNCSLSDMLSWFLAPG